MKNLYIVIVSYNAGDNLLKLITGLQKEISSIRLSKIGIVIVDNNSTDGSIEELSIKNKESGIKIINNKYNVGFAAGCNIGIKYAIKEKAEGVLLINQDVLIKGKFIKPLIDSPADIMAPVIRFQRCGKWVYDYGGRINWWWGRTEHLEENGKCLPAQAGKMENGEFDEEIDYVSGCCALIKKEVFEKIGLFDERFFLYFEDADFCTRAKNAGFTLAVEPKSIIIHEFAEGKDRSPIKRRNLILSNLLFINKYLGWKVIFGYAYIFLLWMKMMTEKSDEKI